MGSRETPRSDKEKFLVPHDLTVAQFMFVLRKRIKLNSQTALFLLVNGSLVTSHTTMYELYEKFADDDGFLYVTYTTENTFG